MVLVLKMSRTFLKAGVERTAKPGNVYFHPKVACVKATAADFEPQQVVIPPPDIERYISNEHQQILLNQGFLR